MQLDKTLIAIHERSLLETLDLSLHTVRKYFWPLLVTFSLGAIPLILVNHLLIGWMVELEYRESIFYSDESAAILRYLWDMTLLVTLEAPLASVFATKFLGDAVFVERPRLTTVFRDVLRMFGRVAWCQFVVRGVLVGWLLLLAVERHGEFDIGLELLFLGAVTGYACLVRSFRPYINEIVLLEQNPLRARNDRVITVGKRSNHLHSPSSGDLFGRWLGTATIAVFLTGSVFGTFVFIAGVFFNAWQPGPIMLALVFPLSMWIVAWFMTVARFLSYLDLRIRHEGWEVELLLRAEAARLVSRFT